MNENFSPYIVSDNQVDYSTCSENELMSNIEGLKELSSESPMADKKRIQEQLVICYLKSNKSKEDGVSSRDIIRWVEKFEFYQHLKKYWNSNLSQLTRENPSIRKIPGRYNYCYDESKKLESLASINETEVASSSVPENSAVSVKRFYEKNLYACLTDWLVSKNYQAKDTSNLKTGGKWGNPDVTGIKIHENITEQKSVEICTVEAKVNSADWRTLIFEAISHKRFSNRVYFIFGIFSDEVTEELIPDYEDFRLYGEKYGIGIAALFIPESVNSDPKDVSLGEVEIREIWPAIYQHTLPGQSEVFLKEQLKIPDLKSLYNFGK